MVTLELIGAMWWLTVEGTLEDKFFYQGFSKISFARSIFLSIWGCMEYMVTRNKQKNLGESDGDFPNKPSSVYNSELFCIKNEVYKDSCCNFCMSQDKMIHFENQGKRTTFFTIIRLC